MTRNGKIARLPHGIREELNHRLRDNVPGPKICEWVNRLPECRKVCAEFARRGGNEKSPVTVNQLSEWRRGGFQDWLREQAVLDETRELRQWCAQLASNGEDLTEGAAVLLGGQLLKLVQGFGKLQASKRPSTREIPSSNIQNGTDLPAEPCAPRNGEEPNDECGVRGSGAHGVTRPTIAGCASQLQGDLLRVADPGSQEMEQVEWAVRVMGGLVKCLWGIRRGDQNRVRLEQSERKLALRSRLAAIKLEKYEKEKAE